MIEDPERNTSLMNNVGITFYKEFKGLWGEQ